MPAPLGPACVGIVASLKGQGTGVGKAPASDTGFDTLLIRVPSGSRDIADKFLVSIGAKVQPLDME